MNTKEEREYIKSLIDEYSGKHFRFLVYFLNGDYENYVAENIDKIIYRTVFGRRFIRPEYKNINSEYFLLSNVLQTCEETIYHINKHLSEKAKEQGIQKVIDNNPDDYANIKAFAIKWLSERYTPFTSDDLRADYEKENNPPVQPAVYGGVFSSLSKEKLITHKGYTKTSRGIAHHRDLKIWKSLCVSEEHYEQSA